MTKKFWKDWQKRVLETSYIELYYHLNHISETNDWPRQKFYRKYGVFVPMNGPSMIHPQDRIIQAEFNRDNVTLVIEKYNLVMNYSTGSSHYNKQNYIYKLNRNDICSVHFIKRGI